MKIIYFFILKFFIICFFNCKQKEVPTKEVGISDFVKVKISWVARDFPLSMKIYEPALQRQIPLWETNSVKSKEKLPVSIEIPDSTFTMQPGSKKFFVLVTYNSTQEPVYFFAAPHQVTPPEFSLGFKFKCLCVNHAFQVPVGEYWYRMVELRMSKNFRGNEIDISHDLIGLTKERMQDFSNTHHVHEHEEE